MQGVTFEVSVKQGATLGEYRTDANGEHVGEYITGRNGYATVTGIEPGFYLVKEVKPPLNYILDETPRDVEFVWGQLITVEFTNDRKAQLLVKKVDSETGAPLAGALFRVTKANGELIEEYTSGTDGFINVPELTPGFYIVSELRSPEGYLQDQTPKTIEVKSGETTEMIVENQPVLGKIQIVKKSAEYNDVSKLPAGSFLEGTVFEIFNSRNEVVDRITTDERGIANSKDLPAGEIFGIREITAPDFYLINPQVLYAEVKKPDDLIRFEILDANEEISLNV